MNDIKMIPVQSSNVESIGYDEKTESVYVQYLNGGLYIYKGVNQQEFNALLNAPSIGSYLHRNFKGVYPYERIG